MLSYQIGGYFSTKECEKIKQVMEGKTYFNFHIKYGGIAGNNTIMVTSNNKDYNNEDLKEMFIYFALCNLK